jgi:hypothetical protein
MPKWRCDLIKQLVKYSKADPAATSSDPWAMFRLVDNDFNANRANNINPSMVQVLDELMSAYRPRKDKLGGSPNISFIMRKPKPLGTEIKACADGSTCCLTFLELQAGKEPMRLKELAGELGACTVCSIRVAQGVVKGKPRHTILGDSWFASVKVTAHPPTNAIPTCACNNYLPWLFVTSSNNFIVHVQKATSPKERGMDFIGVVKTGHNRFPKGFLEQQLTTLPAGSRLLSQILLPGTNANMEVLAQRVGDLNSQSAVSRRSGMTTPHVVSEVLVSHPL